MAGLGKSNLDAAANQVRRLGGAEERPQGIILRQLRPELLPLLRVPNPPRQVLVHLPKVSRAVEVAEHRVPLDQVDLRRVLFELDEQQTEDPDAGVARGDGRVPAGREDVQLERERALLGHAEASEGGAVCGIDAGEALVEHE